MPRKITVSLSGLFESSSNFLFQAIDICPDTLWEKGVGGWPYWQHICHSFGAIDFFLMQDGDSPVNTEFSAEVVGLLTTPASAPDKKSVITFCQQMKAAADARLAFFTDAELPQKNKGLSSRLGKDMDYAATLGLLSSHALYHLGVCDTALREAGLKGIL